MKAYLCSTSYNTRSKLYKMNSFLKKLKADWKDNSRVLYIASFPDAYEMTDKYFSRHKKAFIEAGLSIKEFNLLDHRNMDQADVFLKEADVIILCGGHCPTEMKFFKELKLATYLKKFDGIIIGTSAGTMNAQEIVYAQPEEEGEAIDPNYKRFYRGLGLTKLMILPHYYSYRNHVLDGLRVYEDITYDDSVGREFHIFPDGTYLYVDGKKQTIYGEFYLCKDRELKRIQGNGEKLNIC